MSKKSLSYSEVIVIVLIVGIVAVILLPALAKRRETRQRRACVNNLKQLGLVLYMYANENKGQYPPVDDTKNNFTFDANLLYPEYLTDPMLAMCPADPRTDPDTNFRLTSDHSSDGTPKGQAHPDCFTGDSYVYLGWMVLSDKEVEALFKAYDDLLPDDCDTNLDEYCDTHLIVPEGWGNLEGDTLHRLTVGVDRFLITDINAIGSFGGGTSVIPVMWDRPHTDTAEFSHRPVGGNVLYLDGHVDYRRLGAKSPHMTDPMTETMARLLAERPRARIPDCE